MIGVIKLETKNDEKETNFVPLALESIFGPFVIDWSCFDFNNQIKNFLIKHNGDAYAVSEISRADVKRIWRQTLLLILMPLNRPAQKQFLKSSTK